MFFRRRFGRRRAQRKTGLRKRKSVRKVSSTVKRYVKKAIHSNIENKEGIYYGANNSLNSWGSANLGAGYRMLPKLYIGTDAGSRIGNQVRLVKGVVKGTINLLPYDATSNPKPVPLWVKIFFIRDITLSSQNDYFTQNQANAIFRTNGNILPFQGNPLDLSLPVNSAYYRLLGSRTFKLGSAGYSATTPVSSGSYYDNSPMAQSFSFNWGKYCKKILKYNDTTGSACQNDNMYMVIQVVGCDGQTTSGNIPAEIHFTNSYKFEDA